MKVKMLLACSDHAQSYDAEEVYDLSDEQAERWVAQGLAEKLGGAPEAATQEPEENTALPRGRKRGT